MTKIVKYVRHLKAIPELKSTVSKTFKENLLQNIPTISGAPCLAKLFAQK